MIEASITLLGNLVDDPELRCTQNGNFVCSLRLASTARRFDRAQSRWVDGTTVFLTVTCWRRLAENVAASLKKGDRTLVVGRLRQRSFETHDGNRRVVYEVDAETVAIDLVRQSAVLERVVRGHGDVGADDAAANAESDTLTAGEGGVRGDRTESGTEAELSGESLIPSGAVEIVDLSTIDDSTVPGDEAVAIPAPRPGAVDLTGPTSST